MHSITKNKGKKSKSKQSWTTTYGHWSGGLVWCCIVLKLSFSWALLFWLSLSRVTREFYRFPQWRRAACGESWRIGRNHTSLATCIGYVVFDPEQPKAHKLNKLYIHFNILALTSMLHVRTLLTKYCKHCRSWLLSFYERWREKNQLKTYLLRSNHPTSPIHPHSEIQSHLVPVFPSPPFWRIWPQIWTLFK